MSLFGNQQQQSGSSLFGNTTTSNAPTGASIFGKPTNTTNTGSTLFGASTSNQQPTGASIFSNTTSQTNTGSSLFGAPQAGTQTTSHFQPQPFTQQQQQQQQSQFPPFTNPQPTQFPPNLSLTQQQDLARSHLQQSGFDARPNEKSIPTQTETLVRKWDPNSQDTLLQAYLYNAVSSAYAPFYNANNGENEAAWEKALADAPTAGDEGLKFVPVLVRGFHDLGVRVEYQAGIVKQMRARLHEMNNSLTAVMATHQQRITTALEKAKRTHAHLSQRTLRLAVKVQVLRNRGYALDVQEEALRKQLIALEQKVQDPTFAGREDEIWGRMVVLRERARWLEEEGKRVGQQVEEQQQGGRGVSEDVLQKTNKILRDYEGQLRHLARELEEVRKEFAEWEAAQQRR